ncbi:MAG: NAD(+) diphosphatase [Erysipelotrichaceae bacterium]|nr:NAD(+) diphosphatase [Erysipelotrichaceae bacterium]
MIQDIQPHRFDNTYRPCEPDESSIALSLNDEGILAFYDEEKRRLSFPLCSRISRKPFVYLFSVDGRAYFLYSEKTEAEGFERISMKDVRALDLDDRMDPFICFCAFHLWKWYRSNIYCGSCGRNMMIDEKERALRCPDCGNVVYPRINPAVIVGVINGDQILLTKYKRNFAYNALVAGFCEFGETLEETVRREVKEETGLDVKNIRYYRSQPWGIALDLLAGFYCDVDGDDMIIMDDSELKSAVWVKREDIELQPKPYSLTNEMMQRFKEGKENETI